MRRRRFLTSCFNQVLSSSFKEQLEALASGTTVPIVNKSKFNSVEIVLAPLSEQRRIVALLDEAFNGIATAKANAEKNLQNTRAVFQSHLEAVFSQRGEGWMEAKLGEVCTLRSGTTVSLTLEKPSGDLPYLKVADMSHAGNEIEIVSSSRFLSQCDVGKNAVLPAGTTIFPKRGGAILTNKKRLTAVPICADLNIMGVIPGKVLQPKFLYFYFLTVDMKLLGSGSSIPQINNYDIEPLPIPYPESARAQGAIIDRLEDLAVETRRLEAIYQRKLAALDALKKVPSPPSLHRPALTELDSSLDSCLTDPWPTNRTSRSARACSPWWRLWPRCGSASRRGG